MLTLMAFIHNEKKDGYECVPGKAYVDEKTGVNRITELNDGSYQYVKKLFPDTYYQQIIDDIIGNNKYENTYHLCTPTSTPTQAEIYRVICN